MSRRALLLILFAALSGVLSTGSSAGASAWTGDFETGNFRQWGVGTLQAVPGSAAVTTDHVRQGKYAARFIVGPGDNPIRATGERSEVYTSTGEQAGTESWWAWSTYFPDDFHPVPNSVWNIFTQWHNMGPALGQANAHFEVDTTVTPWKIELRTFGGQQNENERRFHLVDFQPNHWFDFILHVRWAPDNTGFVEVWVNGKRVLQKTFTPTLYSGQGVYLKQGFYRAPSDLTSVLYQDGMRRGDSYDAVALHVTDAVPSPAAAPSVNPRVIEFVTRPRLLGHRTLVVTGRAPETKSIHVVVRGPHGRVLGSSWTRAGKTGRVHKGVRLWGLRNQRMLHVTLVLPPSRAHVSPTRQAAVRATTTVRLSRRDLARAAGR